MLNIFFVSLIIFLGGVTSYEDLRLGKIRNQWILFGLISGISVWLGFFFFSDLVDTKYLLAVIVNFICASVFSFLLWRFSSWAAGDAKMFIVYSLLTPLYFYSNSYLNFFPSFIIIFNTFLLLLTYLLFRAFAFGILRTGQKIRRGENIFLNFKEKIPQGKNFILILAKFLPSFLFFMMALSLSYQYLIKFYEINFLLYQAVAISLVIIFSKQIIILNQRPYAGSFNLFLFFVLLFLGLWWDYKNTISITFNLFSIVLVFLILFPLLNKIINSYLDRQRGEEIYFDKLVPGMILKKETIKVLDLENKLNYTFIGLSVEDVDFVQTKAREKNIDNLSIFRPFYFAVWMFLGVIVTLIFKGSILNIL